MTRAEVLKAIASHIDVSRETEEKLESYVSELSKWTERINLISRGTRDDVWGRHILDSAQVYVAAGTEWTTWIDIGSGGGLPGIVVAILSADDPDKHVTLIESDQRKAVFLAHIVRYLNLSASVHPVRIEQFGKGSADIVSARALAPLSRLLSYSAELGRSGHRSLFLKGKSAEQELTEASKCWTFSAEKLPSWTSDEAVLLDIQGIARV